MDTKWVVIGLVAIVAIGAAMFVIYNPP